jgi:hypothetical protein
MEPNTSDFMTASEELLQLDMSEITNVAYPHTYSV